MFEDDLGLVSAPEGPRTPARFWTHARQQKATPLPLPAVTPEQHAAGLPPPTRRPALARPSSPARQTALVPAPSAPPFAAVLKMYMTFGGGLSVGSGFVVGRRAVFTAGHCVYADGRWAEHTQFIPQYANGRKPVGSFRAVKTTTLREFTTLPPGPRYAYDIAACVVDRDFPDDLVPVEVVVNAPLPAGLLQSVGYPAEAGGGFAFDGERMWASAGDYHHEDDAGFGTTAPRVFAHFNDMTGGCSGGPIFDTSDRPRVVGLNSHVLVRPGGRREHPPRMFSPYFGDAVTRLVRWLTENGGQPHPPPDPPDERARLRAEFRTVADRLNELVAKL